MHDNTKHTTDRAVIHQMKGPSHTPSKVPADS
jgi:hypothetical protein